MVIVNTEWLVTRGLGVTMYGDREIAIDMTSYHLGVTMYDHVLSTRGLCEIQPSYQGFIFRLVVGCREI